MGEGDGTKTATPAAAASSATAPQAALPTVLGDRYQIEHLLGAGGMGVVYAARDLHLGRRVAIKLVGASIDSAGRQGRLEREAQAMARLRHPNIATVYDIGATGDRLFVVMELVDGGTLADWLEAEPRSWRQIVAILLQAARGLSAAHAAGFIHRDFKPENVLLGKDGVPRVGDFGVARLLGGLDAAAAREDEGVAGALSVSRTGGVVGTPGYIAPEILKQQPVDARADQFSFCVALYAAIEGERPFATLEGPSRIAETLGALRPPRSRSSPRWLQKLIVRGLATHPQDRWPTLDALTAAIDRRLGRRRVTIGLVGVGVAAIAILAVVMMTLPAPPLPPDWSPVVIKRQTRDSRLGGLVVSRDSSTLASFSDVEADVEQRTNPGPVHHVAFPLGLTLVKDVQLSRAGDRLYAHFLVRTGIEIWSFDVAGSARARRVPPADNPTLEPNGDYDVGPDGSIVFVSDDGDAVWRVDAKGAAERLLSADPGEKIQWPALSPDGARLVFEVRSSGGVPRTAVMNIETRVLSPDPIFGCGGSGARWLNNQSLICTPWSLRNVVIVEKTLSTRGEVVKERLRHVGPEYQRARGLWPTAAGVLFATAPSDQHLMLFDLASPDAPHPIALDSITDLSPVGWTSSGSLIFGANIQGRLRIMALRPGGTVETVHAGPVAEVPLAVLDETIVFGRFPEGESWFPFVGTPDMRNLDGELFRISLADRAVVRLGKTNGFQRLMCAGARRKPCLLAERFGDDVRAFDLDVETGARGPLQAHWPMSFWESELSFDGRTLAQVRYPRGNAELSFLDLESGQRRETHAELQHPQWRADGSVVALGAGRMGLGLVLLGRADEIQPLAAWTSLGARPGAFKVSPDGKTVAILTMDENYTYWWADGPTN